MKSMMMIMATFFAVCGIASGAYTYTVGPGEHLPVASLNGTESMLVQGGWGVPLILFSHSSARIENTTPLGYMTGGIWEMTTLGYSSAIVTGGEFNEIYVASYSSATITGGEFNVMYVEGYSHLTMSGGEVNALYGQLDLLSGPGPNPGPPSIIQKNINIISKSWDYNSTTKRLTGTWADDSLFNIQLMDTAGYPATFDCINFTIVPEPLSLGLLALGSLLVRRHRRVYG